MDIMSIKHNSLLGRNIKLLFFVLVIGTNRTFCQSQGGFEEFSNEKFQSFIELFYAISEYDTLLVWQPIEYETCRGRLIDSSFYSFVHFTPYFYPYAMFKVECPFGFLTCIRHSCPAEQSDLQFVELSTFDTKGNPQSKILIPYIKNGCLTETFHDATQLFVSRNLLQIHVERVFYGQKETMFINNLLYKICDDGNIVLIGE